jgi:hypothetical protein
MKFSDEMLMAFADGELDEPTMRQLEQAIQADPALAAAVARHRALRADVFAAFVPVLDEAIPARLAQAAGSAQVIDLASARPPKTAPKPRWSWPEWGALAAMLMVGVAVGRLQLIGEPAMVAAVGTGGTLAAQGALAQALSQQLSGTTPNSATARIGVSFIGRDGNYCRSFLLPASAGLACKHGEQWEIPVMAASEASTSAYRLAGSETPPAILEAIDQRMAGKALGAQEEQAARDHGWQANVPSAAPR